jgi:hypothetical protein
VYKPPQVAPVATRRQQHHSLTPDCLQHGLDIALWERLARLSAPPRELRLRAYIFHRLVERGDQPGRCCPQDGVSKVLVQSDVKERNAACRTVVQEGCKRGLDSTGVGEVPQLRQSA